MELQFQTNTADCLQQIMGQVQSQEQTQELKLSDGMPDIGRVLCAWGQGMIRGKEWQGDTVGLSGGVMAWILYSPEDGSHVQCVQAWLPMSFRWDIPETKQDGKLICNLLVKSVDARVLSGRKLMLRATAEAMAQVFAPVQVNWFSPEQLPADIQLKQTAYPMCLAREAGEKAFMIDEELTLPQSVPELEKLIRFSLQPEVEEQKVLGDKAVFRGRTLAHVLYRGEDGAIAHWDFEIPFSQYTQLEQEYGQDAQVQLLPQVTSMEMEPDEQGRLRLKAGLTGQYVVYETQLVPVVEDAYSPDREVSPTRQTLEWPGVLERQSQRIRVEQTGNYPSSRIADVAFYPYNCRKQQNSDELIVELPGQFQTLYYDPEGVLQAASTGWQDTLRLPLADSARMEIFCAPSGTPQANTGEESTALRGEVMTESVTTAWQQMDALSGLTVGEPRKKDPNRPSLILRKAGKESIWNVAKEAGSTVEAIRQANGLQGDPEPERMLLIPVL